MTDEQDFTMPSNPADRKKIKDALHEMSGALQFIADKRAFIKDVADAVSEQYEIPKKILNKMARTLFKNDYSEVAQESDQFTTVFETLFQSDDQATDSDED